jgi:hypothetical protein
MEVSPNVIGGNEVNGIHLYQEDDDYYHGSYNDIQIVNNNCVYNGGYGVTINVQDHSGVSGAGVSVLLDLSDYYLSNLVIANNIIASNDNANGQLRLVDTLEDVGSTASGIPRSYMEQIFQGLGGSIENNCYYTSTVGSYIVSYVTNDIGLIGTTDNYTYSDFITEVSDVVAANGYTSPADILRNPQEESDTPTDSSSPYETLVTTSSGAINLCIDNADSTIGPPYYGDPTLLVPVAPDIDGVSVSSGGTPDIGAYEISP